MSRRNPVSVRSLRFFKRLGRPRNSRKVFISYRRSGGQAYAMAFHQILSQVLGDNGVFIDVGLDAMEVGAPWRDSVRHALDQSDTLLLVLDPGMAGRLANPDDAVRFELETAIQAGLRVAVVRVENAEMVTADALPETLAELPTLHSPILHSDTAMADMTRVVKDLTGRIPGEEKVIDRWDWFVFVILAALGAIAWVTKGAGFFNTNQALLWGSALLGPWILWMSGRRTVQLGAGTRTVRNLSMAGGWFALGLLLAIPWFIAFNYIYKAPVFSSENSGILVARFEGDPSDEHRDVFIKAIKNELTNVHKNIDASESLVQPLPYFISNIDEARRYGATSGAAAVLWGQVTQQDDSSAVLIAELYLNERKFRVQPFGRFDGYIDKLHLELKEELGKLQTTLPRLLEGYRIYFVASETANYKQALSYFSNALEKLEGDEFPLDSPLSKIVATLHFFQGNTFLLIGQIEPATTALYEAVQHSLHENDQQWPTYIEAVNNLGWVLAENGEFNQAIHEYRRADLQCDYEPELETCAYVWYNLGIAWLEVEQYDSALIDLQSSLDRLNHIEAPADSSHASALVSLKANTHQNRSYALWQKAMLADVANRTAMLEKAEIEWNLGRQTLLDASLQVPDRFFLTKARFHMARGKWNEALDVLADLQLEKEYAWTQAGLRAGALYCDGKEVQALQVIQQVQIDLQDSGAEAFQKVLQEASKSYQICNITS